MLNNINCAAITYDAAAYENTESLVLMLCKECAAGVAKINLPESLEAAVNAFLAKYPDFYEVETVNTVALMHEGKLLQLTVVGCGEGKDCTPANFRKAAGAAVRAIQKQKATTAIVAVPLLLKATRAHYLQAIAEGLYLGAYKFTECKGESKPATECNIQITSAVENAEEVLAQAEAIAQGVTLTRNLVNRPGNWVNPVVMAEEAQKVAEAYNLEIEVLDRTALILKIFALRAKTYEAKLQVEIASLKYELPRLSLVDANFSQQSGGSGVKNKGTGEKQIELDRRKIRTRINFLEKELEKVTKNRLNQRKKRIRNEIPKVALVGYTNAGKSSLLNTLLDYSITTNEKKIVMEKDMLFATLDTSTRLIKLPSNKEFLVSDTVGFINKLPTTLIKAFRSTLEEALDADLILLVSDISNKNNDLQLQVTLDTLNTIEANSIPILYVFNKCDLIEYEYEAKRSDAIIVSTKTKQGIDELLKAIEDNIFRNYINCMMHIPYEEGKIYSYLSENANISIRIEDNEGYLLSLELKEKDYNKFKEYVIKED